MAIRCRLVEFDYDRTPEPGDMWFTGKEVWETNRESIRSNVGQLAPEYFRDNFETRPPLCVVLPNGDWFFVDCVTSDGGHGWTVSGEPPNITVSPSIHYVGRYHGWLQNGVLTDGAA